MLWHGILKKNTFVGVWVSTEFNNLETRGKFTVAATNSSSKLFRPFKMRFPNNAFVPNLMC